MQSNHIKNNNISMLTRTHNVFDGENNRLVSNIVGNCNDCEAISEKELTLRLLYPSMYRGDEWFATFYEQEKEYWD